MWINYSAIGERLHHVEFELALLVFFPPPETFSFGTQRWKIPRAFFDLLERKNKNSKKNRKWGSLVYKSPSFFFAPLPINLTFFSCWGMWSEMDVKKIEFSVLNIKLTFLDIYLAHKKCFDSFHIRKTPSSSSWKVHWEIYTPIYLRKIKCEFLYRFKTRIKIQKFRLTRTLSSPCCRFLPFIA